LLLRKQEEEGLDRGRGRRDHRLHRRRRFGTRGYMCPRWRGWGEGCCCCWVVVVVGRGRVRGGGSAGLVGEGRLMGGEGVRGR
jgi:hypothetical protein